MSGRNNKKQRKLNRQRKLFWGSSYDRGLDILLFMWPDILQKFPDAELHICYGWDLFDKTLSNNPERMQWKASVQSLMNQRGIVHHGRVGQEELKKIRQNCGVWAYPTYFTEINCITALQAQQDGLVPVVANLGALKETVGSGMSVDGNIKDTEVQKEFLEKLLYVMEEQEYWSIQSKKAQEFAKNYAWEKVSNEWISEFEKKDQNPLVSICTVTIREGFWNIMAENIAKQSYKNIEWIIVDDHKEDRSEIAKKYAKQYGITIRYLRGTFHLLSVPRRYGLVQANNIAWKAAKGELLVYLQDFILMPERGIEDLVTLYLHNPNSLLAPVDQYWYAKEADQKNKEDWWNGKTDVIHSFSWRNVRVQFEGVRKTTDPFDFEMNYCAIPKHIIEKLNGWWEFFDDGLGYDNTEFASRALKLGYTILIDDTNIAKCINLWPVIGGTEQNIAKRERYLATPYFKWLMIQMDKGKMPVIRDEKLDKSIKLTFEVPEEIEDEACAEWINRNTPNILEEWGKNEKNM